MTVVSLQIAEPADGSTLAGTGSARLRGLTLSSGHPTLFYKWYSSLVRPPTPTSTDASIPVPPGGDPANFVPAAGLPIGSQVLTFSAKDVQGDSRADLERVQHAGVAGGPPAPGNPAPCVVHVLIAGIVSPAAGASLSKASSTLEARAPLRWLDDAEYAAINRLQYRWRFTPEGPPAGRASADLVPRADQLVFDPRTGPEPKLRYQGALPPSLGAGSYRLALRVESSANPSALGHEVSVPVVLVA